MKKTLCLIGLTAVSLLVSFSTGYAQGGAADEKAVRDLDLQWSVAAANKDLEKTVSFYAADALVLPPNAPAASTKEAIRKSWKELLESPNAAISWTATKSEMAKSGEIAYTTGTYQLSMSGPDGAPINDKGKYVEIWKKQADGKWKCAVDIYNSDQPAAPAGAEKK